MLQVVSQLLRFACLLPLFLSACSGDSVRAVVDGGEIDGGETSDAGSSSTGSLVALSVSVWADCPPEIAAPSCSTNVQVIVYGRALERIADASVTVNDAPLPSAGDGTYGEIRIGLAPSYTVVANRGTDEIETTLAAPSDFGFSITPDPPHAGEASTVAWSPSGEGGVIADVLVISGAPGTKTTFIMQGPDTGEMAVPATAFPAAGGYIVQVSRNAYHAAGGGSVSTIVIARRVTLTVP